MDDHPPILNFFHNSGSAAISCACFAIDDAGPVELINAGRTALGFLQPPDICEPVFFVFDQIKSPAESTPDFHNPAVRTIVKPKHGICGDQRFCFFKILVSQLPFLLRQKFSVVHTYLVFKLICV